MPGRKRQAAAIMGAALLASALAMPSAHAQSADSDDTTASITADGLTLSNLLVDNFGLLSITGTAQTTTADVDAFTVSDLRGGVGGGWALTAEATQFTAGANTLPASSLDMQVPVPTSLSLSIPPTVPLTPVTLDNGPVEIASADPALDPVLGPASGTGEWTFDGVTDELTLSVPADVLPGDYLSTVTMTLAAAP